MNESPKFRLLLFALAACFCGCAVELPPISMIVGADRVAVFGEDSAANTNNCTPRGRITAEDGAIGSKYASYEGTESRVLQKLRNEAKYFAADTAVITNSIKTIPTEGARGLIIKYYAQAYDCS